MDKLILLRKKICSDLNENQRKGKNNTNQN